MRRTLCLLVLVLAGCPKRTAEPGEDWSTRPLEVTPIKLGDLSGSVELPSAMKEDPDWKQEGGKRWQADKKDYFSEPSVTLSLGGSFPASIDAALAEAMIDKGMSLARKESAPGSYLIEAYTASKSSLTVRTWKSLGARALTCSASQAKTGGVPSPDETLAWLERICLSAQVR